MIKDKALRLGNIMPAENKSEAFKLAWKKVRIMKEMRDGIAYFSFIKKSTGEKRDAIATLRDGNFEYDFKGSEAKKNARIINFWDVEKKAWRSCDVKTII